MKIIRYIVFLFLFVACDEKELSINLDKHENKLVVNSFFTSSDSISINLSKSIPVQDDDVINFIDNADVYLYCQNELVNTMNYLGKGVYSLNTQVVCGKEYSLSVDAVGYKSVSTSNIIPDKPLVLFVDTIHISKVYLYCELAFKNDVTSPGYYLLEAEAKYPVLNSDSVLSNHIEIINSDMIVENGDIETELERIVFSTELLYEPVYDLGFVLNKRKLLITGKDNSNTVYIHFKKITEEYYLYVKSYYASKSKQDEIYSNVKNGYGIFAGFNTVVDTIVIKE